MSQVNFTPRSSNADLLAEYLRLLNAEKDAKALLDGVKEAVKTAEKNLLTWFADNRIDNVRVDGVTVYRHESLKAAPVGGKREALYKALKEAGFSDLVKETVHAQTLTAFVKEYVDDDGDLVMPNEQLQELVTTHTITSVRTRKG